MGYFSNGTEGMVYEEEYCSKCIHSGNEGNNCPVMLAHILKNYEECNNEDSILNLLIPRDEEGFNKKCLMFIERAKCVTTSLPKHLKEWGEKQGIVEVKEGELF